MTRDRHPFFGLAKEHCYTCHGSGWGDMVKGQLTTCLCIYRAIFSICYARYQLCFSKIGSRPLIWDGTGKRQGKPAGTGNKAMEYIADFQLVSRRALSPLDYRIFRLHFLDGHDAPTVCRMLGLTKPQFWGRVYLIKEALGQRFALLKPFPLLPDMYFGSDRHTTDVRPFPIPAQRHSNGTPLVPPLAARKRVQEPEPVVIPMTPLAAAPESSCPFDTADVEARDKWIRKCFAVDRISLHTIVLKLNRFEVPPLPGYSRWSVAQAKRIILNYGGLVRHQPHLKAA
jgi:hypothetical protein